MVNFNIRRIFTYIYNLHVINNNNLDNKIDTTLMELNQHRTVACGPLEEVDYWRYRSNVLTSILEELKLPIIQHLYKIYDTIKRSTTTYIHDLQTLLYESKDNTRF